MQVRPAGEEEIWEALRSLPERKIYDNTLLAFDGFNATGPIGL